MIVLPGQSSTGSASRIDHGFHSLPGRESIAIRAGKLSLPNGTPISSFHHSTLSDTDHDDAMKDDSPPSSSSKKLASGEVKLISPIPARYIAAKNDSIIATITHRFADSYRLNTNSAHSATLDALAFLNVTRKSRPQLNVGDVLYTRITGIIGGDLECACFDAHGKNGGYGALSGGRTLTINPAYARKLLHPSDVLLTELGKRAEYEIVVGVNGRIWISADDTRLVLEISKLIQDSELLTESEVREALQKTKLSSSITTAAEQSNKDSKRRKV